jgi:hypothetical protein
MTPANPHRSTTARPESPRVVVVATLSVFWATLLLALGVPGAGPILVAALGGSAMVALRRLLGGRVRLPAVRLPKPGRRRVDVRPALARVAEVGRAARLPRAPKLPSELGERARSTVASVRSHRPHAPKLPPELGERARSTVASLRTRRPRPRPRRATAAPTAGGGRAGEAWELCRLGAQLRQQGGLAAAVESFETAVWIFRDLDEPRGLALALNGLGLALVRQRRLDAGIASYREAVAILDRLGDGHAHGQVLANLGTALRTQGRSEEARASWEDALQRLEPDSAEYARIRELRAAS